MLAAFEKNDIYILVIKLINYKAYLISSLLKNITRFLLHCLPPLSLLFYKVEFQNVP